MIMAELPKERLDEREFERLLESLWDRVKKGEFTSEVALHTELDSLIVQAGFSPDDQVWGFGKTEINDLVRDIRVILPYVHLGVPIVETRRKIRQLKDRIHWGPKWVGKMVADISGDMEWRNWSPKDLGLSDNWVELVKRSAAIEAGKRQLAGLRASTHEKPKAAGMRDLENYLRKHGLTMADLA
jgi:hypothetical protein